MTTKEIRDRIQTFEVERTYEPADILNLLELLGQLNERVAELEARPPQIVRYSAGSLHGLP